MEWVTVGMMTFPIWLEKSSKCSKAPTRIWCHAEKKHIKITWMVGDTPYKVLGKVTNGSIRCYDIPMTYQIPIRPILNKWHFDIFRAHSLAPDSTKGHSHHKAIGSPSLAPDGSAKVAFGVSDSSERGEVFLDFCDQFYHQHVNGNSRILKWRYCTI